MDKEFFILKIIKNMKDNGEMIFKMVSEFITLLMGLFIIFNFII
jgi:hypothetical protein